MTASAGSRNTPQSRHAARVAAARAYVKIAGKLNREVDPDIVRLSQLPRELSQVAPQDREPPER